MTALPSQTTSERLIAAVKTLATDRDVTGISSRALAEYAGVSASAINYTFGSLDHLIASAIDDAHITRAKAWRDSTSGLSELDCHPNDLGMVLYAGTREFAVAKAGDEALFWADTIRRARLNDKSTPTPGIMEELNHWAELLRLCGLETIEPALLCAFSLALRFAYRTFDNPNRFDPWAMALTQRFTDRLTGQNCNQPIDSAYRKLAEKRANLWNGAREAPHETAQLIMRTTTQIILENGAESATFREIAAKAGLSVSSVQHFFGSRNECLNAAYHSIYEAARERALSQVPKTQSLNIDDLLKLQTGQNDEDLLLMCRQFAAMSGLTLSASYNQDTRVLAEGLIARAGQTSLSLLCALLEPRGQIGRLDAQLFSLIASQFITLNIHGSFAERGIENISELNAKMLRTLFV